MAKPDHKAMEHLFVFDDPEAEKKICQSIATFKGPGTQLESALGALVLGQHLGIRVLKMLHSPGTFKKYEDVLGIRYQDYCPDRTRLSRKVVGIKIADRLEALKEGGFWDVVMGRKKVPKKGYVEDLNGEDSLGG